MLSQSLLAEFEQEAQITKRMLEKVPYDNYDWKPHEKSMPIGRLAAHISEISAWPEIIIGEDELDFAKMDYKPPKITDQSMLMKNFEENIAKGKQALQNATDEKLNNEKWRMRRGEQIFFELPKAVTLRTWVFSHTVHHRAQLGVYLRLINIQLPSTYGPTADQTL